MKLNLYPYADVSTGHITKQDAEQLHRDAVATDERKQRPNQPIDPMPCLFVFEYDSGFFVHTDLVESTEAVARLAGRYSPHLLRLLEAAHGQDAVFLRLDRDGACYPEMTTHDW